MADKDFLNEFRKKLSDFSNSIHGGEVKGIKDYNSLRDDIYNAYNSGKIGKADKMSMNEMVRKLQKDRDVFKGIDKNPELRNARNQMGNLMNQKAGKMSLVQGASKGLGGALNGLTNLTRLAALFNVGSKLYKGDTEGATKDVIKEGMNAATNAAVTAVPVLGQIHSAITPSEIGVTPESESIENPNAPEFKAREAMMQAKPTGIANTKFKKLNKVFSES